MEVMLFGGVFLWATSGKLCALNKTRKLSVLLDVLNEGRGFRL